MASMRPLQVLLCSLLQQLYYRLPWHAAYYTVSVHRVCGICLFAFPGACAMMHAPLIRRGVCVCVCVCVS